MTSTLIHISVNDGHHPSYQALFVRLLQGEASTGAIRGRRFWRLVRAPRLLFATIDSDYLGFIAVALLRSLQNKPTTAIFLRSMQCFRSERSIVYPMKRAVFSWLRHLPRLRILAIVPFDIYPNLEQVSHGWIHDPQMWDLWVDGPPKLPDTDLSRRVEATRRGRKVMIFVGKASSIKGFSEFVEIAHQSPDKMLVVVAGQIASQCRSSADSLRSIGMIVEDRFVTDEEILSLYKVADCAWCRYAPGYDQASGVFGRAFQTGVEPIMRDGSVVHTILSKYRAVPVDTIMAESLSRLIINTQQN